MDFLDKIKIRYAQSYDVISDACRFRFDYKNNDDVQKSYVSDLIASYSDMEEAIFCYFDWFVMNIESKYGNKTCNCEELPRPATAICEIIEI